MCNKTATLLLHYEGGCFLPLPLPLWAIYDLPYVGEESPSAIYENTGSIFDIPPLDFQSIAQNFI